MDKGSTWRWVIACAFAVVSGCATPPREPWVSLAVHATGDGQSRATPVRFGAVRGGPLVFVLAELAWLDAHGYTRVEGGEATGVFVPGPRPRFLHAWPVRDAGGRAQTIYFDKTPMVASPVAGHLPAGGPAQGRTGAGGG